VSIERVFCFESYGVKVRFVGDSDDLLKLGLEISRKALVGRLEFIDNNIANVDQTFGVHRDDEGAFFFTNNGVPSGKQFDVSDFSRTLNSMIRIHVAEKAKGWVFIHAGVVSWRGRAIVLPGQSRQGKTTLVAELIKCGAEYFSDEYAVIDENGFVHPFERALSMRREGSITPVDVPADEFGARSGKELIPIGLVIITSFEPDAVWDPKIISVGQGILEIVPQVIPIKFSTEFSLKVLNTAFSRAIIIKTLRGEAPDAAKLILSFFDNSLNLGRIL
jgi:hypothetical protein